uniref:restriction endonuclease subunit S n=1 Tax=Pseudoruminococcus massiliensis TaxID=2086583 RepID=UPI003FEF8004
MSAITAKASRKMKKYAVLTREPRCFLGSFDFSWEQRKLGDIADIVGGGTPSTGNQSYWDGDIDWYAPAEIADQIYANSSQKKITGLGYENSSAKMLPPGTVLFTSRAGIGKTAILTRKGCTNQGFQSIVPHRGELDSYFIFSRTEELKRYGEFVGAGSTFVEVSGKQMAVMELMMPPTMREQQTIGGFFQQLDHLITLHQRKCALLFSPFQAFISMMFTTSTFSWEQREVGDLLIERSQQAPMSDEYPLMAFIANEGVAPKGERYDRSALVTDTVNKLYKKTEKGDFIYSSNNLETGSIGLNKYGKACISPVYSIFEPTGIADSDFLGRRLVRKDFINAMVKWRQGVIYGQWRIHESDFLKIEISVPSVEEQRKIGAYLDQLDNLITLHQRKCIFFTGRAGRLISTVNKKRITSSWEQRKLASLCEKFTDGDWIESKDQSDFGVRLVQTGNVGVAEYLDKTNNKKWISEDTFDRLHCEEVLPGDILISRLPEPAGRACIVPLLGTKMITAVDCTIVRTAPDMSNKFLVQYLSSQAYFDDVNTCLAGGTRQRISRGNLANFNVPIPVKKSEQDAIGMFFGYLDNL